ncbi:amidase domain-containing protein [Salipaludibacillus neizhouensis]|nr:amidase domain-containing protein [Salipaludibacillus neizhouensis]
MKKTIEVLEQYWKNCLVCFVGEEDHLNGNSFIREEDADACKRKLKEQKTRQCTTMKNSVDVEVLNHEHLGERVVFDYLMKITYFHFHKKKAYLEEINQYRRGVIDGEEMVDDYLVYPDGYSDNEEIDSYKKLDLITDQRNNERFEYERLAATRYAERWWDDYNPEYNSFDVDCTNYISQCLRAGGAPMKGIPNRGEGWWNTNENWSFSWAVAHSFRWYLSGSNSGLQAREVSSAEELMRGDVICYDFNGDGRWQHTTIVVDKDANRMPLVNAHTTNSRMRYWAYEDSTAWTPKINYKFFQIVEQSNLK